MENKKNSGGDNGHNSLLRHLEADLDANYHRFAIPHPNKAIATWYLLTVLEDNLRNLFVLTDDSDAHVVEFHVDRQKYSARFALDRIRKDCKDTSQVALPSRVVPKIYLKTAELIMAGVDFASASQLCSAAHANSVEFEESDENIEVVVDETQHDIRYAALELLGHMPLEVIDHSTNLYVWVRNDEFRPRVVDIIADSVRISEHRVFYEYLPHIAVALASEMSQHDLLIPEGWRFPWGGRYETTLLINALCVRCMYHWIAVHFGASLKSLKGGGKASILYVTSLSTLLQDLQIMCSLDESVIREFVRYLSYGYGIQTPDPALQPIIAVGSGQIAIPCLLFLSSNYERSLLILQARIDPASFNTLSELFEEKMVSNLLRDITPRWPLTKANVTIRVSGEFEEIDLLVADKSSRTLLVCELRWMLQPGDPREVQNRKKACWQKTDQLERKVRWLRARVTAALQELEIDTSDAANWHVEGVVVIETFGGVLSRKPEFPIMTTQIFTQGMLGATSLRNLVSWSHSLCWLPQDHVHFRVVSQSTPLTTIGKNLITHGIEKLCSLRVYRQFVEQSIASLKL